MKSCLLTLMLSFLGSMSVFCQNITLSGTISENGSSETLIGATIYIPSLEKGTSTNEYGNFSLTIPQSQDSTEIIISFIGYVPISKQISLSKSFSMNYDLESGVNLESVEIQGNRINFATTTQISSIQLSAEQIKNTPAILGEKDLMKTLQLLPGVQSGSEGSAGIYVRGGGPDQNLIILDDAPIYNANHLFGFFSTFNGDAIKNVELIKGGFPARYGGRLSSVIDIRMKDGSKDEVNGELGVGIIASRLTIEGPIKKGKTSFLISGRRTYLDALTYPFQKAFNTTENKLLAGYFFYDFNMKVSHIIDDKNRVSVSGYLGRDKFFFRSKYKFDNKESTEEAKLNWGNTTGTLRWNHKISDKLYSNFSLISANYKFQVGSISEYKDFSDPDNDYLYSIYYSSGINDIIAKSDFDYKPNNNHQIRFGYASTLHVFTPEALAYEDSDVDQNIARKNRIYSPEQGAYIEDEIRVNSRFYLSPGLRVSVFGTNGKTYFRPEPRINSRYMIREDLSAKLAFAQMNQYVHLLSTSTPGLPTDLWVPATSNLKPQSSTQVAGGIAKTIEDKNLNLSAEVYYKHMNNIIAYKEGASFFDVSQIENETANLQSYEDKVLSGTGQSYGTELFIQYNGKRFNGWIGYTISKTTNKFEELNDGKSFNARYDRTHDISVVGSWKINDRFRLSATWVYGTGNAITLPVGRASTAPFDRRGNFESYQVYGDRNAYRMRAYHRGDIALQSSRQLKRGVRTWEFGLYNAYSRANPFFYTIDYYYDFNKGTSSDEQKLLQVSLFPIIPSISYSFKF